MSIDPEVILWGSRPLTEADGRDVVMRLVSRLTDFLHQDIDVVDFNLVDDESFTCRVAGRSRFGGPLALEWWGILGMEPIEGAPHVSGTLFLYSMGQRLGMAAPKGSTIELVYERSSEGGGAWRSLGWVVDTYDEWEGIRPPWGADRGS